MSSYINKQKGIVNVKRKRHSPSIEGVPEEADKRLEFLPICHAIASSGPGSVAYGTVERAGERKTHKDEPIQEDGPGRSSVL